ncbi:hypothetical protein D8B26_004792 [Coccidioides posadasii str. Silveira]|uniref:Uncharacterized protein n=3 Tax=Coccidioides posadasii TaxID=199306 RepID=E9D6K4_COCPS|nr:hypothetical protein CPC735_063170 [Coccidioides posadasii C735 delta SOWgp]EER28444.1 hypothetical protein CPC735_063170 [Coccidioides posadasii C735 delta SOWgp]EFW17876.1 conserved hypothetical protein [Coccidioides posadasii str. Silveira]KMM68565.1 hypothetical protein CPAG_04891 [Coccidioides posadasii RMSCC 3488]QVM10129.1 hypothetical protein D8B26_004792 [Coccidioides posadasii str. Silveira]|eukprot:XP_003070589.1 hypothetical protein CPC735_063170 [Coccidioides posadasii C735 delta SOWgp]
MAETQAQQPQEPQKPQQPLSQTWEQPSHSAITVRRSEILASGSDVAAPTFCLTAIAAHDIPANSLFAVNTSTTLASSKDYSTVQISTKEHIRLNSDLLYCNHSCDPNVRFVTSTLTTNSKTELETPVAGVLEVWSLRDIPAGEELRFFYPSTEWEMSQPFRCSCGAEDCLGWVDGAKNTPAKVLERYWLSGHIAALVAERERLN